MDPLKPILSGLELTVVPQIDQALFGQDRQMTDDTLTPAVIFVAVS
jgi:hypothetical protein